MVFVITVLKSFTNTLKLEAAFFALFRENSSLGLIRVVSIELFSLCFLSNDSFWILVKKSFVDFRTVLFVSFLFWKNLIISKKIKTSKERKSISKQDLVFLNLHQ